MKHYNYDIVQCKFDDNSRTIQPASTSSSTQADHTLKYIYSVIFVYNFFFLLL